MSALCGCFVAPQHRAGRRPPPSCCAAAQVVLVWRLSRGGFTTVDSVPAATTLLMSPEGTTPSLLPPAATCCSAVDDLEQAKDVPLDPTNCVGLGGHLHANWSCCCRQGLQQCCRGKDDQPHPHQVR